MGCSSPSPVVADDRVLAEVAVGVHDLQLARSRSVAAEAVEEEAHNSCFAVAADCIGSLAVRLHVRTDTAEVREAASAAEGAERRSWMEVDSAQHCHSAMVEAEGVEVAGAVRTGRRMVAEEERRRSEAERTAMTVLANRRTREQAADAGETAVARMEVGERRMTRRMSGAVIGR